MDISLMQRVVVTKWQIIIIIAILHHLKVEEAALTKLGWHFVVWSCAVQ